MEKNEYHILNGDALREQLPTTIDGNIIVARECLVDGDISGETLESFYQKRASFLQEYYGQYHEIKYQQDTVTEFKKILSIPKGTSINLWFEDDLFCQINLWFVCWMIETYVKHCNTFLVRPKKHDQFGFGGLHEQELAQVHSEKQPIDFKAFSRLWVYYKSNSLDDLLKEAEKLNKLYPFILPAVKAHLDRIPGEKFLGRPKESLRQIMNELSTSDFSLIFQEFCKRESIYGFGDLQVKRLLDELISNQNKT